MLHGTLLMICQIFSTQYTVIIEDTTMDNQLSEFCKDITIGECDIMLSNNKI